MNAAETNETWILEARARFVGSARAGARWLLLGATLLAGCGSSTGLKVGPPSDGGVDGDDVEQPRDTSAPRDVSRPIPDAGPPFVFPEQPVDPTCFELPSDGPIELSLRGRVRSADVLFFVDRTGSMAEEIDAIREQLASILIPQLRSLVGSLAMGVAVFDEVDYQPYGVRALDTVRVLAPLNTDPTGALAAIAEIEVGGGTSSDPPEAAVPALDILFRYRTTCVTGSMCLRPGVVPVVLLFTDAAFHNGPDGDLPYEPRPPPRPDDPPPRFIDGGVGGPVDALPLVPANYEEMLVPVRAVGARVLGLYSGEPRPDQAIRHLRRIARDTGALDSAGQPVFFDIGERGERVGEGIAAVVSSLFASAPIAEVRARVSDVPGDDVDASAWVRVVPSRVLPSSGATIEEDFFRDVRAGAVIIFRLEVNPPADAPVGVYPIEFVAVDGLGEVLDQRIVRLVIPGPGVSCEPSP